MRIDRDLVYQVLSRFDSEIQQLKTITELRDERKGIRESRIWEDALVMSWRIGLS